MSTSRPCNDTALGTYRHETQRSKDPFSGMSLSSCELQFEFLVSPLLTPILVPIYNPTLRTLDYSSCSVVWGSGFAQGLL